MTTISALSALARSVTVDPTTGFIRDVNLVGNIIAGDYVEGYYASSSTNFTITAAAALTTPFIAPANPSVTFTVTPVGG